MNDIKGTANIDQLRHPSLSQPLFDANASATAQPVEPIHRSRLSVLSSKLGSVSTYFGNQTRALAVVIIVGLITGAMGGMFLVNVAGHSEEPTELAATGDVSSPEMSESEEQSLDAFAADLRRSDPVSATITPPRRIRPRARTNRPRAYRVAVIR